MADHKTESKEIFVHTRTALLRGDLAVPAGAKGLIIFAHGSGSGRFSPRNRYVAEVLQSAALATLLIDLLTDEEEILDNKTAEFRFNIDLLADRVCDCIERLQVDSRVKDLPIGLFGASTGAAAALIAAARRPKDVFAVVSRGGRPDLAKTFLPRVEAPTLLIVGGDDHEVLRLNRDAAHRMVVEPRLEVVLGATHLFEESGALERAARLASDWFKRQLRNIPRDRTAGVKN